MGLKKHGFVVTSMHREADKAGGNAITANGGSALVQVFSELLSQ